MNCEYCDQEVGQHDYVEIKTGVVHEKCEDLWNMFLGRRHVHPLALHEFRAEQWVKDMEAAGNMKSGCPGCGGCSKEGG